MPRGGVRKVGGDALLLSAELIGWAVVSHGWIDSRRGAAADR